jgi:hypothetical protein
MNFDLIAFFDVGLDAAHWNEMVDVEFFRELRVRGKRFS